MAARKAKTKKPKVRRPSVARPKAKTKTKPKRDPVARKSQPKRVTPRAKHAKGVDPKVAVAIALALEIEAAEQPSATRGETPSGWLLSGRARRTHTR